MKRNCLSKVRALPAFGLFLVAPFLSPFANGQEPPPQGSFRFVNASAIAGRALVTIDNNKFRPDGFGPGDNTGIIGILTGAHRFDIVHPTGGKAEANLNVQPNTLTTVVAYSKPVIDPQTKKTAYQIQLIALGDPPREKGKHFHV